MAEARVAPYGSWKSPITSDLIVAGTVGLGYIRSCSESLFWIELRPTEKGRQVLVRRTTDGRVDDLTPMPFNARTRAHEYGGCPYLVTPRAVYFSNFADQRLYVLEEGRAPRPITPEADIRYADCMWDAARGTDRLRARGPHAPARPAGRDDDCEPRSARPAGRARAGGRQRLLLLAAAQPRWLTPGLADVESPQHAVGRDGLWLAEMAGDGAWRARSASPADRTSPSSSRNGRRTASCTSCRTERTGGTCTAGATGR